MSRLAKAPAPDPQSSVIPFLSLKKEQKEAITILCNNWKSPRISHPGELGLGMLPTGFSSFFSSKVGRKDFQTDPHWSWNQSHRRVQTELFGTIVTLQKFTPKRVVAASAPGLDPAPVPPYKLWIMTIKLPTVCYFVWVERGAGYAQVQWQQPSQVPCAEATPAHTPTPEPAHTPSVCQQPPPMLIPAETMDSRRMSSPAPTTEFNWWYDTSAASHAQASPGKSLSYSH